MGLYENLPYTDLHRLNLNWILKEVKADTAAVEALKEKVQRIIDAHPAASGLYINVTDPPEGYAPVVGDGNTDNTAALAALAAREDVTLFFPAGIYCTDSVTFKCDVMGAGASTAQIFCRNDNSETAGVTMSIGKSISNIYINGNKVGQSVPKAALKLLAKAIAFDVAANNGNYGVHFPSEQAIFIGTAYNCTKSLNMGGTHNIAVYASTTGSFDDTGSYNTIINNYSSKLGAFDSLNVANNVTVGGDVTVSRDISGDNIRGAYMHSSGNIDSDTRVLAPLIKGDSAEISGAVSAGSVASAGTVSAGAMSASGNVTAGGTASAATGKFPVIEIGKTSDSQASPGITIKSPIVQDSSGNHGIPFVRSDGTTGKLLTYVPAAAAHPQTLDLSRCLFFGDSFTQGHNPDVTGHTVETKWYETFCNEMGIELSSIMAFAAGGLGFKHVSTSVEQTFKQYWDTHINDQSTQEHPWVYPPAAHDLATTVFFMGGWNDKDQTASELNSAISQMAQTIRSDCPRAKIVFIPSPSYVPINRNIMGELMIRAQTYFDVVLADAAWMLWLRDNRFASDFVHPTQQGYKDIGKTIAIILRGGSIRNNAQVTFSDVTGFTTKIDLIDKTARLYCSGTCPQAQSTTIGHFPAKLLAGYGGNHNYPTDNVKQWVSIAGDQNQAGFVQWGGSSRSNLITVHPLRTLGATAPAAYSTGAFNMTYYVPDLGYLLG